MMREIMFRAKRKDNGEWVYGYYVKMNKTTYAFSEYYDENQVPTIHYIGKGRMTDFGLPTKFLLYKIDPETLCQFTGLTDKNGKRIYENDIVSNKWCFINGYSTVKFGEYKDIHMSEKYKCGNLGFYLEHSDYEKYICRKDIMYFSGKCEVIGNIFDNKDLMEEVCDEKTD